MTSGSSDRERIFHAAVVLSPEQRAAFLDVACAGHAQLRADIEELLRQDSQAGSFLHKPAIASEATMTYERIEERPGTTIGPYKLMEEIGEGGFGLVFVAEQQQPFRRKVALKIIKPGMDTKEVIARFEAERQALALMDHPNIARALDAGTTESGRPYFVMELVKGSPIVDYCDQHQFSTQQRLNLFVSACDAVQHAHAKGVIHRDLKPSNILVAPHDGRPVVKVIDFGVAKAIGQQLTNKTIYTRFAQMIGTPLYMSPEQAEINALDVDTRSDIYSLGVLLYELLTGTTPFDRKRFAKAAYDEIRRIIREEEPPKPSTRLSTLGETLSVVSANRNSEPAKLSSQVKGDLDWIVMKSLEKDRRRRYETADAFAADVRRFLSEQPIEARPPSTTYRFRKFARRNRVLLTTGAVIAMILLAASIISTTLAVWAVREGRQKEIATEVAQLNEQKAINAMVKQERQIYNLTIGHAFRALDDGDIDRLGSLIERAVPGKVGNDARPFEHRFLSKQYRNHQPVFSTPNSLSATCAEFTPDGTQLLVGSSDATIRVYDLTERRASSSFQIKGTAVADWESTSVIHYSPDKKRIIISGALSDGQGALAIADSLGANATVKQTLVSTVTDLAVSDSGLIVTATRNGEIHAHRAEDLSHVWTKRVVVSPGIGPDRRIRTASVTTNGDLVAAVWGETHEVTLWHLESGKLFENRQFVPLIQSVRFSQDATHIAVSHRIGIDILRLTGSESILERRIPVRSDRIAFSPNGREIAAGDSFGGVQILDLSTSRLLGRIVPLQGVNTVRKVRYASDGRQLFSIDTSGVVKVWHIEAMRPQSQQTCHHDSAFQFIGVSRQGAHVAIWGEDRQSVRLWDTVANEVAELGQHPGVLGMAFSPDGKEVASCGDDGWVRIWRTGEIGDASHTLQTNLERVWAVAFSPSSDELAFAGDGGVVLWNPKTSHKRRLIGHEPTSIFMSIDFSPDGRYLIAGGGRFNYDSSLNQGETLLWDLTLDDDRCVHTMSHPQIVYAVDFSPLGTEFAAGGLDALVKFCNVATLQVNELKEKSWWVTGLAYTPDGSRLVTASPEHVTFWDSETREQLGTFRINEQVRRIAFLPKGNGMVTASTEGYVRLWKASP